MISKTILNEYSTTMEVSLHEDSPSPHVEIECSTSLQGDYEAVTVQLSPQQVIQLRNMCDVFISMWAEK